MYRKISIIFVFFLLHSFTLCCASLLLHCFYVPFSFFLLSHIIWYTNGVSGRPMSAMSTAAAAAVKLRLILYFIQVCVQIPFKCECSKNEWILSARSRALPLPRPPTQMAINFDYKRWNTRKKFFFSCSSRAYFLYTYNIYFVVTAFKVKWTATRFCLLMLALLFCFIVAKALFYEFIY